MSENKGEQIPREIFSGLQSSGFPFQTAVAHVIQTQTSGEWSVYRSEYPWRDWRDPSNKDEFLDIVAKKHRWYAAIECKKTEKESLIFLLPLGQSPTGQQERVRCVSGRENFRLYTEERALWPVSPESNFCVVTTKGAGSNQRLLERDARLLVCATDAFAKDEEERLKSEKRDPPPPLRFYFSIIVTNAPIYTVRYKPTEISLNLGRFEKNPEELEKAPWVRFRKSFTSQDRNDRTVFVVSADNFAEFLMAAEKAPNDTEETIRNRVLLV